MDCAFSRSAIVRHAAGRRAEVRCGAAGADRKSRRWCRLPSRGGVCSARRSRIAPSSGSSGRIPSAMAASPQMKSVQLPPPTARRSALGRVPAQDGAGGLRRNLVAACARRVMAVEKTYRFISGSMRTERRCRFEPNASVPHAPNLAWYARIAQCNGPARFDGRPIGFLLRFVVEGILLLHLDLDEIRLVRAVLVVLRDHHEP